MQFFKVVRPDILSMGKSFVFSLTSAVHFWEITSILPTLLYSKLLCIWKQKATGQKQRWRTADNSNMLKKMLRHKQFFQAFSKSINSKPFIFLGFDSFFENSEKNISENRVILQCNLQLLKSWQSGKENHGSNLFLLKSTIQVHQRNKSLSTVT